MSHKQEREEHGAKLRGIVALYPEKPNETAHERENRLGQMRQHVARYNGTFGLTMAEANDYAGGIPLADMPPALDDQTLADRNRRIKRLKEFKSQYGSNIYEMKRQVALWCPREGISIPDCEDLVPGLFDPPKPKPAASAHRPTAVRRSRVDKKR